MSAGFVLVIWLLIAAVYGSFCLLFFVLYAIGKKKGIHSLMWAGGIPFIASAGFAVFCLGLMGYGFYTTSRPATVYEMTFGSAPSSDVTNIQSNYYYFADTGTTFLKFKASPATIAKLTAKGWTRLNAQGNQNAGPHTGTQTPEWYKPKITDTTVIYTAEKRIGDFASESETLVYDRVTKQAYYDFVGID